MLNNILKKLFGSYSKKSEEGSLKNEFPASKETPFNPVAYIELGKFISNNDHDVLSNLDLYTGNSEKYFEKYKDDLVERSIKKPEELFPEIVLIDALISKDKLIYIDHATEAHHVLTMLDILVDGLLSKYDCFNELSEIYKSKNRYNTIGNFMHNAKIAPMPFKCIRNAGYSLIGIDEGSDSYALFLVGLESELQIKKLAFEAGIKIQFSTI